TLKAHGSLVTLYIRFTGALPPRLSPVLLQAILHGVQTAHDLTWLEAVSPSAAEALAVWP
ncbi:hypothetical protein FISHEDRAFT_23656, partial [Fistulina hepatica ATCC 64428]